MTLSVVSDTSIGITNKLIIAISGEDMIIDYSDYGLTFNSNEQELLEAVRPAIQERFNTDIRDSSGWLYKTRKATESQNIYLIPNSTAG
jgi:hypothetical protein